MPLTVQDKIYGVNVIKIHPENIYLKLTTPGNPLYDPKYKDYSKSDIILDMKYFNNASYLIFQLS